MQPYLSDAGCSLTLKDVANYQLRTSMCGGITPLYNSTELATTNTYCQWNLSCSDTGIMKILVCVYVCVHTRKHVCTYVCMYNHLQPEWISIHLIKKVFPVHTINNYLSTNQFRSINNWLKLITHMQIFQCILHKHANNAMSGAHTDYNCASFKLILILTYTTSNTLHFNYLIR